MSDNYKFLRIYPGLQSNYPIKFKSISFQPLEGSGLEDSQIAEIKKRLGKFKFGEVSNSGVEVTLAEKPLLTTLTQAKDYESFEDCLEPYEQVLFFIANLSRAHPPIYENISFHIPDRGMPLIIGDFRSLRMDPFFPPDIYLSQFHFAQKNDLMQSKLRVIFTKFQSEIYKLNSIQDNMQLSNHHLVASLYWYNKACMMSELLEEKSAIIYFATAFEAFFNIKGYTKKESLGFAIQRYLGDNDQLRKWTNEFYEARNKIVHGSYVEKSDLKAVKGTNYVHSLIAKRVLQECILRQLYITEGLDFLRTDMDANYEYIVNYLLTLNKDKFNKLKNRGKFSYENIINDEDVAKDFFFKTMMSINPNELFGHRKSVTIRKNYKDLTKNLAMIVADWLKDSIDNANFPTFYAPNNKTDDGIDDKNYKDQLLEIVDLLENNNPNEAKDIFDLFNEAQNRFTNIFLRGFPYFLSSYKGLGLYDILDFVKKTAIRLG